VDVSMVNWMRGACDGPFQLVVDDRAFSVARIATHLQLHADVSGTAEIAANQNGSAMGVVFGHEAFSSGGLDGFPSDALRGTSILRPIATGNDLLRGRIASEPDYCIHLGDYDDEASARRAGGAAFEHLRRHVYPWLREKASGDDAPGVYPAWLRRWWK